MSESEIQETIFKLLKVIAPDMDPTQLKPDDDIRHTLGLDSFDALRFVVALDEQFGIATPEADYGKIVTSKSLVEYIVQKLKNK